DHRQSLTGAYSVETWFRTNTARGGELVGFGSRTGRSDKRVHLTDEGRIVFATGPGAGGAQTLTTGLLDRYDDDKWHHVVATQGPAGAALYVDGRPTGTGPATGAVAGAQPSEGFWHVGGDHLAGLIDETAVYPKALTQAQVKNHFDLAKAPSDTVSKVTTTEDTYIDQGSPGTAHGTAGSLAVRGTPAHETYLRFDIPAAPAGQVLKSASLQIETSTAAGAGTTDTVSVVPVTGTWSGAGTTFKTKPTLGRTPLGTLAGVPDGSAVHTVRLDTATLSSVLGTNYGLGLTSTGTDPLWIWSSEAAASDAAPQLVLTFGAK
ncbi:CBM96 family carbohydrate-binding protein, partial [Streptomyces sp. NPDC054956]